MADRRANQARQQLAQQPARRAHALGLEHGQTGLTVKPKTKGTQSPLTIDEAIPLLEQAIRLSTRDSDTGMWYDRIGPVHLLQSRIDEALLWFERARGVNPKLPFFHL